ncbi:MAG TPA: prepilin peptidase, partial [Candidatus Nanoarchaeia archaeon]|nr:prepilin peptidase [Candidatus Nanoarchaeia archaeon]
MINFLIVSTFLFGALIGSFLNVVILRYGTGKKILGIGERSMCFSCSKTLEWYELIPVFSFLYQRGRCRGCKSKISWQYPLVEFTTGLLFAAVAWKNFSGVSLEEAFGASNFSTTAILTLFQFVIWSILIVITVYDIRHKIIPDFLVFMFAGLSLIASIFFPEVLGHTVTSAIVAGIAFFAFFGGLWLVSGGRWLGFGDAKLVLGVGFLLGPIQGLSALVLSFWIG